jgi:tRNA (mo5U34)-methyltransferase
MTQRTCPFEKRALVLADDYPITEEKIFEHPDYPKMYFIEKKFNGDFTNWWFANRPCVHALLRSAGFGNIQEVGCDVFMCEASDQRHLATNWDYQIPRMPSIDDW